MPLVTVKNLAAAAQIVHTLKRTETLPPGQDGTAEFSEGEFESMKRNPFLQLTVDGEVVSGQASEAAKPVAERAKNPVWGEGKNEAGSPLRPGQTLGAKPLSKKAQKAAEDLQRTLDEKRAEAVSLGLELADDLPVEDIQKAIDAKLAE